MGARLAIAAVIGAAVVGFWVGERHATREGVALPVSSSPARPSPRDAVQPAPARAPAPSTPAPVVASALPPLNTPVSQVLEALRRDARAGDMRAACRLAFELERCQQLRSLHASISSFRELAERPGIGPELAKRYGAVADRDQARYAEGRRLCEGVSSAEAKDAWRYMLQAARAGHGPSMARFASRRVFADADPVAALDGLIAFRNEGPAFLARAAQAGYPEAYEQLAFAYVSGIDLGLGLPHDAVRGVAYYTALMRVAAPAEGARLQRAVDYAIENDNLNAAEVARARSMAEPLAAVLLRRNTPGTVEIGRGPFGGDNGSHCER